ncbi:MAG: DUF429 domain-containing protein [Bacteroidales bacterium]|nr:DUF429 domain-containing protein [Bacteroidales bacterium]MCF8326981.1 DUF429 domain-containing protein [Bacteroidales bacterium]
MENWLGIDYGSKMQGTTAVAYEEKGMLQTALSEKGKDADRWLFDRIDNIQPHAVCIDAPLSLPGVYTNSEGYTDYFYRKCDSELGAMSPMFIGGLTARAMKFADQLHKKNIQVYEAYPGGLARKVLPRQSGYKKKKAQIPRVLNMLIPYLPANVNLHHADFAEWHQVDALLTWIIGYRISEGMDESFGNANEGVIRI